MNGLSPNVVILTRAELQELEQRAFQRGVERGKFEARMATNPNEPVSQNCAHWKDGYCESCGAQHQSMEVGRDFRCPYFTARRA